MKYIVCFVVLIAVASEYFHFFKKKFTIKSLFDLIFKENLKYVFVSKMKHT